MLGKGVGKLSCFQAFVGGAGIGKDYQEDTKEGSLILNLDKVQDEERFQPGMR